MARLIDSSLWIDLTRARSSVSLRAFVSVHAEDNAAHVAEPIAFEVLRYPSPLESRQIRELFARLPVLPTPPDLWEKAVDLGQTCRRQGITAGSMDLLIAVVAIHHDAELVTFDAGFEGIGDVSRLRLTRLRRPS